MSLLDNFKLNHRVFWPPFTLLAVSLILSLAVPKTFQRWVNTANDFILQHFDWLFNYTSFFMVILCTLVFCSPLGKVRIGGPHAMPLMSRWRWFGIVLCTSVAVGILFWGTAEPLYHLSSPPVGMSEFDHEQLESFAMSTMFMHWSFTPYAIYAVPTMLFALAFFNHGRDFSLGSMLFPMVKGQVRPLNVTIDILCLFALVAGMAASLGAGLLSIAGGMARYFEWRVDAASLGVVALAVVGTFTASAASGLLRGIKWLSALNMFIFIFLVAVIFTLGPSNDILHYGWKGLKEYMSSFVPHSLSLGAYNDSEWTHNWTSFYWANWMAWAPVTALFLGRISYGYTIRQVLLINWVLPALFSMVWMSVFSGTVLSQQDNGGALIQLLNDQGPQAIIYRIIHEFPFASFLGGLFIFTMFISYVTAADSNTMAMSGLSSTGISPRNPEPSRKVKYIWGMIVGLVAWVMVSYAGIDGIKMLSNLGGLPALGLMIACCAAMVVLLYNSLISDRLRDKG